MKSSGKCLLKKKKGKTKTPFKDKTGKTIYLGDLIKVYSCYTRIVKYDRAWSMDDREKCFGVTVDGRNKPLYRYQKKDIEIIRSKK